jgi:hypothetical protein
MCDANLGAALALAVLAAPALAHAAPLTVGSVCHKLHNPRPFDIGLSPGPRAVFGATAVMPNGDAGSTGAASRLRAA